MKNQSRQKSRQKRKKVNQKKRKGTLRILVSNHKFQKSDKVLEKRNTSNVTEG
jgi:hypothetical protein